MSEPKKYGCYVAYYASRYVEVDAANEAEAKERALDVSHIGLCHQCASKVEIGDAFDVAEVNEL